MNLLDGFSDATVLVAPGLRDHVSEHLQTNLVAVLRVLGWAVHSVPTMGRDDLECAARVAAIEREAQTIAGPLLIVAHSGGVVMLKHPRPRRRHWVCEKSKALSRLFAAASRLPRGANCQRVSMNFRIETVS